MFCIKCGEELTDDALFCTECGYKVQKKQTTETPVQPKVEKAVEIPAQPIVETVPEAPAQPTIEEVPETPVQPIQEQKESGKRKGKMFMIIALILFVAVIAAVYFLFFGGRSEKKLIDQWVDAYYQGDAKKAWNLFSEPTREIILEKEFDGYSEKELIEELQLDMDEMQEAFDWDLGRGWTYKYHIIEEYVLDKEELETIQFAYEINGYDDFKISAAKVIEIEVDLYDSYGSYYDTEYFDMNIIKEGNSWSLFAYD